MDNYSIVIKNIVTIKNKLQELQFSYLLPDEVEMIKSLPFSEKMPLQYLNRRQAISLLDQFEMGISLQRWYRIRS